MRIKTFIVDTIKCLECSENQLKYFNSSATTTKKVWTPLLMLPIIYVGFYLLDNHLIHHQFCNIFLCFCYAEATLRIPSYRSVNRWFSRPRWEWTHKETAVYGGESLVQITHQEPYSNQKKLEVIKCWVAYNARVVKNNDKYNPNLSGSWCVIKLASKQICQIWYGSMGCYKWRHLGGMDQSIGPSLFLQLEST